MLDKYPHLRKKRDGFLQYCLHAPEGQALLRRFLAAIIPALKDHQALHSICLSNEPVNAEEPCEFARHDWHAWLQKQYGDTATLNRRWRSSYASFDEIPLPNPFAPSPGDQPAPLGREFVLFNQEFFAGWHAMMADAIHQLAPGLWRVKASRPVDVPTRPDRFQGIVDPGVGNPAGLWPDTACPRP